MRAMTVRRVERGQPLPPLVTATRQVILGEANSLRVALDDFSTIASQDVPRKWTPRRGRMTQDLERMVVVAYCVPRRIRRG